MDIRPTPPDPSRNHPRAPFVNRASPSPGNGLPQASARSSSPQAEEGSSTSRARVLRGGQADILLGFQHQLAVTTRQLSARGMERVLHDPAEIESVLSEYGEHFRRFLGEHAPSAYAGDVPALELKFRKGIANGALQHATLLHMFNDVFQSPSEVVKLMGAKYRREKGDYFAFELRGPGGKDGFRFFEGYSDARHGLMAAAVRMFGAAHSSHIAASEAWSQVERVKNELTAQTKQAGLREAYRTQPVPKWPQTVWSLSQNLNSALVSLRAALGAVQDVSGSSERSWSEIQRPFFDRPGDLKALAGVSVQALGEYTQPNDLPGVKVMLDSSGRIQSYKWDEETDARLRHDPGGVCFGFQGLHQQSMTAEVEQGVRRGFAALGIQLPPRFSSVEMLTMAGALLLPCLAPDFPRIHAGRPSIVEEIDQHPRGS